MPKDVTRQIAREVERELWARSAGRCEFSGCNRVLYKSPVTEEQVNIADKAHIYSFSPDGTRGWGPLAASKEKLNDVSNLMLVCHDCHKTIDQDKEGKRYPAGLLIEWKRRHEQRVEIVTGIRPDKKSHVVLYGANIGQQNSPLRLESAVEAMFPDRYPADERPIDLSMSCTHEDHEAAFWRTEADHLRKAFDRRVRPQIEESDYCHFSLFSLAPQPLLMLLGTLLTDKIPVDVYQLHREPQTWNWQSHPEGFHFKVIKPERAGHNPVLAVSLSDRINHDRITSTLPDKEAGIWELTVEECHNDILRSQVQLSSFRQEVRRLMVSIKEAHGQNVPLRIFPAMPIACAVEFGRARMPKADMPWFIYDQNNKVGGFVESIRITGEGNEQSDR